MILSLLIPCFDTMLCTLSNASIRGNNWVSSSVPCTLIGLNVLISIMSDSFELALSQQVVNKYTNRVSINKEVTTFYNEPEMVDCIVVSIMKIGDSEEDWSGFVDSIKTFIKK